MRINPCLAEETSLDHIDTEIESDFGCDWSSDPMEILMHAQERMIVEFGDNARQMRKLLTLKPTSRNFTVQ